MVELWSRVERLLEAQSPESVAALAQGASDLSLARLAKVVGGPLPPDLVASLTVHDGQKPPRESHPIFDAESLLSCEAISTTWTMRGDILKHIESLPRIRQDDAKWWSPSFLPVTEANGNGFCIHRLDNSVHYHTHDGDMEGPLFPSWRALLEDVATKLERGQFTVENGSVWLKR
jgi:cell wall assembly regulator SMI1